MRLECIPLILVAVGGGVAAGGQETAPPDEAVRELRPEETTPEALVDALAPAGEAAPLMRGGSFLQQPAVPDCSAFAAGRTRGIRVTPSAPPVALEIHFATGSAEISDASGAVVGAIAAALTSPRLAACCFRIEGHTDSVGPDEYNLRLSEQRAQSVAQRLSTELGVEGGRLLVEGFGESQPIADNSSADGRRRNRRVQIVNLGCPG